MAPRANTHFSFGDILIMGLCGVLRKSREPMVN
jgi:hypothetical protein